MPTCLLNISFGKIFGSYLSWLQFMFLFLSFRSFFVYFGQQSFTNCVFCRDLLPGCGLSFHFLDIAFLRAEVFHFNEVQLVSYFFQGLCLWCWNQEVFPVFLSSGRNYRELVIISSLNVWQNSLLKLSGPEAFCFGRSLIIHSVSNRYSPIQIVYFFCVSFGGLCLSRNWFI